MATNNARAFIPMFFDGTSFTHSNAVTAGSFNSSTKGPYQPVIAMQYVLSPAGTNEIEVIGNVDNADNIAPIGSGYTGVVSVNLLFDTAGNNYDRARVLPSDTDAQDPAQIGLAGGVVRLYALNSSNLFDRLHCSAETGDTVAPLAGGMLRTVATNYFFDGVNLVRARVGANNADAVASLTLGVQAAQAFSFGYNGATWDRRRSQGNNADAIASVTLGVQDAASFPFLFNGATFDRQRGANVFKSVVVTAAGDTTIWTPTSGKKFRLMGLSISASGTAAALVADLLKIQDGAGGANLWQGLIAVAVTVTGDSQIFVDFGQGRLSGAINTVLNANLATAFTAGGAAVNAWGTEE